MKINTDRLVDEIFGDLGFELSPPKDYALSIMNYFLRYLKEKEWISGFQIDDIEVDQRVAKISVYLINSLLPIKLEIVVKQEIDYEKKGVLYLIYELEIQLITEVNFVTETYHQAEEFLLFPWDDFTPIVERLDNNLFEMSGEYITSLTEQFIPISTIEEDESVTQSWSREEKDRTNFAALALSIANFLGDADQHFEMTTKLFRWFRERKIDVNASSEPSRQ